MCYLQRAVYLEHPGEKYWDKVDDRLKFIKKAALKAATDFPGLSSSEAIARYVYLNIYARLVPLTFMISAHSSTSSHRIVHCMVITRNAT